MDTWLVFLGGFTGAIIGNALIILGLFFITNHINEKKLKLFKEEKISND